MPLYEYQCDACGHRFEKIQKFSDPLADTCPVCGGPVHKLMSSPAIQFKGSGFYITDYAKKEHTAAAKADKDPGAAKDSKESKDTKESSTGGTDTKETKSEKAESSSTPAKSESSSSSTSSSSDASSKTSSTPPTKSGS